MSNQLFQSLFDGVSTAVDKEGLRVWFEAQGILGKLGLSVRNASKFLDRHVSADFKRQISSGVGRPKWYVSEEGVYQLGMQASTFEAIAMQRWIFQEVLPAIQKDGGYISPQVTKPQAIALSQKLEKIITPDKRPWTIHFDKAWQKEATRLCGVTWSHPRMGQFINQTVYDFFPKEAIAAIKELNANGQQDYTAHHQCLTPGFDKTVYAQHLRDIYGYMLASPDLTVFWRLMESAGYVSTSCLRTASRAVT